MTRRNSTPTYSRARAAMAWPVPAWPAPAWAPTIITPWDAKRRPRKTLWSCDTLLYLGYLNFSSYSLVVSYEWPRSAMRAEPPCTQSACMAAAAAKQHKPLIESRSHGCPGRAVIRLGARPPRVTPRHGQCRRCWQSAGWAGRKAGRRGVSGMGLCPWQKHVPSSVKPSSAALRPQPSAPALPWMGDRRWSRRQPGGRSCAYA